MKKTVLLVEDGLTMSASYEALRSLVSNALDKQVVMDNGGASCYAWIQNMFPGDVVYSCDGEYYQRTYSVAGDVVTFGPATEVEMSWAPVAESAGGGPQLVRSRALCAVSDKLVEAYDSKTGELTMTVIRPGFNLSKSRYYPADTLRRDYKIFEGAKMFADHQTDAEAKQRPEGSVNHWVASVKRVWAESDGTIKANAAVIDPTFKAKMEELAKANLLTDMGVSIRAIGEASRQKIEGTDTNYVESLVRARSVDFVTYAGAGGQVEALEADSRSESDVDLVTEAQLRDRRPDLVALVESQYEVKAMKTLEQQLQEANAKIVAITTERDTATAKLQESEKGQKLATAAAELTRLLSESQLPDKAKDRLRTQFKEAVDATGMKEAIVAEQEYIKSLGAPVPAKVRNLGEHANGTQEGAGDEGQRPNLVESFKLMGLTEEQAKIAAAV